jgi:hypothetical protein
MVIKVTEKKLTPQGAGNLIQLLRLGNSLKSLQNVLKCRSAMVCHTKFRETS